DGGGGQKDEDYAFVCKLRGLPWNATDKMVVDFFVGVRMDPGAIMLLHNTRGEAFAKFTSEAALEAAIKKDKERIGRRYIEVFRASPEELAEAKEKVAAAAKAREGECRGLLRMRGLPWAATPEDVAAFFAGSKLKPQPDGVRFVKDRQGRPSGEAIVTFETVDDAKAALSRDKERMGERYIDLFTTTELEAQETLAGRQAGGPSGPAYGGMGGGGGFGGGMGGGGGGGFGFGGGGGFGN
ncbi:unnamed protein product, partial [Phaeothamnion confervicola]